MASSFRDRAERRAGLVHAAIEDALSEGATQKALNIAVRALQSEAAKVRKRRPADEALADSELAGSILAIASGLHAYKPRRPAGCPRVPGPEHLITVFTASHAKASGEGEAGG